MLSRVAERLYWTARYLERAEDTARLVNAYTHLILDIPIGVAPEWHVLIDIVDAEDSFRQRYKNWTERNVVKYLLVNRDNPSSISFSIHSARENVRTTRDVLPAQAWELVNELSLYVAAEARQAVARQRRFEVLTEVIARTQQINGLIATTVLRDQPLWFLQLGQLVERADMTSRIVDVGDAIITERGAGRLTQVPTLWGNLLRSLSATSAYRRKVGPTLEAEQVFNFILRDQQFPRSLLYCVNQMEEVVGLLRGPGGLLRDIRRVAKTLAGFDADDYSLQELRAYIDSLQHSIAELHDAISETWFHTA